LADLTHTQYIKVTTGSAEGVREILRKVYSALVEKGYDPIDQIVGYIMSGDPTFITGHNNARSLIMKVQRDEYIEELLRAYIEAGSMDGQQ